MADETILAEAQDNTEVSEQVEQTEEVQEPKRGNTLLTEDDGPEGTVEGQDEKPKEEQKQEAPEDYGDFEMPEGVTVDVELMGKAKEQFKELGLTKEQAQKLVSLQTEAVKEAGQKQLEAFNQMSNEWKDATIKELGANYKKELSFAKKAIKEFGDDEVMQFMDDTRVANHPAVARMLIKIGKAISEDGFVQGKTAAKEESFAEAFYKNQK